jgi:acetyl esterase/lipase
MKCKFLPPLFSLALAIFPALAQAEDAPPQPEVLSLWNGHAPVGDGTFSTEDAEITIHRAPHPNGAAVVICPGGGYAGLVLGPEGHGIAQWLNLHGITGVVLKYRLPHGRHLVPLLDSQRAVRLTRLHAAEWGIDPTKIGIIGFSAGGHVASTEGTHYDRGDAQSADPIEKVSSRPDFMILVYPVITFGEKGHAGSRTNLLGPNPTPELIEKFSNEKQVTDDTPPAFLAHAADDKVVPSDNSRMFAEALQAHKVPAEFLELPSGGHGLNGYKGPMWDEWQTKSLQWLVKLKFIPAVDANAH